MARGQAHGAPQTGQKQEGRTRLRVPSKRREKTGEREKTRKAEKKTGKACIKCVSQIYDSHANFVCNDLILLSTNFILNITLLFSV